MTIRMNLVTLSPLALLLACAPQDAEINAEWYTWLAANSSQLVDIGQFDEALEKATVFECSGRGWNETTGDWDNGYVGPEQDEGGDRFIGGACDPDDGDCDPDELASQCEDIDNLYYYTFLQDDGFYALKGQIDAYRSEAYINGEGDFQLTVHHALEADHDLRFQFSIDPDFDPYNCVTTDSGDAETQYVDGSSWLDQWAEDEDGYKIYYLNAGAYQINPSDTGDYWYVVREWTSGVGFAKISSNGRRYSAEDFVSIATQYGDYDHLADYETSESAATYRPPLFDAQGAHFLATPVRTGDLSDPAIESDYEEDAAAMEGYAAEWAEEMSLVIGGPEDFEHKVESNQWRPLDTQLAGLDGWMELNNSWVRVKEGTTFAIGSAVEGDYQIVYQGTGSASRMVIRGTFKVAELREDRWAYPVLEEVKRDENGVPYCGGSSTP